MSAQRNPDFKAEEDTEALKAEAVKVHEQLASRLPEFLFLVSSWCFQVSVDGKLGKVVGGRDQGVQRQ